MAVTIVVGLQWGDEGKGKVVDLLARDADVVIRSTGGNNAGHSIINERGQFVLHLVPAGIFNSDTWNIIERGVVVHPPSLAEELRALESRGVSAERLMVSLHAHLVMPWSIAREHAEQEEEGSGRGTPIGTTLKGIGPTYQDKAGRKKAFRIVDLLSESDFLAKLERIGKPRIGRLKIRFPNSAEVQALEIAAIANEYAAAQSYLLPWLHRSAEIPNVIRNALSTNKNILLEGSQGTLLDPDFGTYPYVTSSGVTAVSMCLLSGILPQHVSRVVGVAKAYMTRVGQGPFPTEMDEKTAAKIRELGREYGATTGRPRRCGWLDMPLLRYAANLNNINGTLELAFMKVDILGMLDDVKVGTRYAFPQTLGRMKEEVDMLTLDQVTVDYLSMRGWGDITAARSYADLAPQAQAFVQGMCWTKHPIGIISVGPERDQTITMINRP